MTDRFRITAALGIIQILTWGSSFYLLAVLAGPITSETEWPFEAVAGGVSIALMIAGVMTPHVARMISARGGRMVMAVGIGILICGLLGLAAAPSLPLYLIAWAIMGAGMSATLYEAAFSTLATIFREGARGPITQLTLWGGFASTICWPISAWMVESLGWRGACLGYVALHLCVTLPLCWWGVPPGTPNTTKKPVGKLTPDARHWLLIVIAVCLIMAGSVLSIHLISILTATGLSLAAAVALGALIGPAQVGARALELLGREHHSPLVTLLVAIVLIFGGLVALRFSLPTAAALIAFGAGNGLFSIARGTVPLATFGAESYPQVMAFIARPVMFAAAVAPVAGALLIERFGTDATLSFLAGCALAALVASLLLLGALRHNT